MIIDFGCTVDCDQCKDAVHAYEEVRFGGEIFRFCKGCRPSSEVDRELTKQAHLAMTAARSKTMKLDIASESSYTALNINH